MTRAIDDTTARRASAFLRLESGLLRRLRHERTEQGSQSLAPTLGALDLPLVVLADRQGERHFTIALAAVVFVHWHRVTSLRCADSGGQDRDCQGVLDLAGGLTSPHCSDRPRRLVLPVPSPRGAPRRSCPSGRRGPPAAPLSPWIIVWSSPVVQPPTLPTRPADRERRSPRS